MFLFKTITAFRTHLERVREKNKTIGFVPTMGALHSGHRSLIAHSLQQGHCTVVSIYVNPTQFNDASDLEKYPRPISADLEILMDQGCQVVFLPADEEIYPPGKIVVPDVDLEHLGDSLEAAFRPGHFEGVLQVMHRLLDIVQPDFLFMGRKELQQLAVVRKLIDTYGLSAQLIGLPIVREPNGLARSSRNERLSPEEREQAGLIFQVLQDTFESFYEKSLIRHKEIVLERLGQASLRPEYFEFVRSEDLHIIRSREEYPGPVSVVVAAWCGDVRLIDNMEMPA